MALAGRKFRVILIGMVAALLVAGGFASTASAQSRDRDCADFDSQQEAQRFFENQGGPQEDPNRLDRDNDDEACETFTYDDDDRQSASSAQYQYRDGDQQQQQQQQQVINIPQKPLPVTAGPSLLIPAGALILGVGLTIFRVVRSRE